MIPRAVVELDHPHAPLGEPSREQTVGGVAAVAGFLHSVEVEHFLRLVLEIHEVGHARLHLESQFVLRDARGDLRIVLLLTEEAVHPRDLIDDLPLRALTHAVRIPNVVHRVTARLKLNALESARQHAAAPLARRDRLLSRLAGGCEHDETRQILRLRAEAIGQPRAHAGPALDDGASIHERVGRVVVDLLRLHRPDHAELIREARDVRKQVAHLDAGFSVLLERREGPTRLEHGTLQLRELLPFGERLGKRLIVEILQHGLPIKRLELRRSARHAEKNHALRLHWEMRRLERSVPVRRPRRSGATGERCRAGLVLHHGQREAAETIGALGEKRTPVDAQCVGRGIEGFHGRQAVSSV